jgi:hypothetical protein
MLVVGHAVRIKAGHILLDLVVEPVQNIVESPRPGDRLPVPPAQCVSSAFDHRVEHVDHPQDLSCRMAKRDGRRFRGRRVEVERLGGVGWFDPVRQHPFEQARERSQHRQERQSKREVEGRVEIGDGAREIRLDLDH